MSVKRKASELPSSDAKKPKANASITSFFGPPKTVSTSGKKPGTSNLTSSSTSFDSPRTLKADEDDEFGTDNELSAADLLSAAAKFDAKSTPAWKEAWVKKLCEEQRELLKLEIETLDDSWLKELRDEVTSKEFLELKRFLKREVEGGKKVFPPMEDVYSWSRHTPLNTVKAVILGQDPYHNHNQAHGLAFSVRPPTPAPPSLVNIYKCLRIDYPTFVSPPNKGGLLTPWADRGVLLLNTCLTVRAHEANSHANRGWEKFTSKVIEIVDKKRVGGVVFLAWGTPAGKRVGKVDKKRHCVLQSVHPSPLSASRGWFECGHFRKTNEWLKQRYGEGGEIDWNLDGKPEKAGL